MTSAPPNKPLQTPNTAIQRFLKHPWVATRAVNQSGSQVLFGSQPKGCWFKSSPQGSPQLFGGDVVMPSRHRERAKTLGC